MSKLTPFPIKRTRKMVVVVMIKKKGRCRKMKRLKKIEWMVKYYI